MAEHMIRCGDHVHHTPSDETWVVAWADYATNDLAWCGWPNGIARLSDCTLVKAATDDEHAELLARVLDCGDSRASTARRLYVREAAHG
ncbi:hypothetical protein [Azorhizobium doebereinerae]|uniref:hypothetical protein n=1 Tax=Azorhizobium doebereinerae TaxID=281091 RepID=UPI000409A184|nr:hypothetical protein [Azorhizobium doebereinerae]